VITLGFMLLSSALRAGGEHEFSWGGLGALALGTLLIVIVEAHTIFAAPVSKALAEPGWVESLTRVSVALIFVAQAAYGVALLRTALAPQWVGWLTVLWNLGWLAVVFLFSASNPYYPALFYLSSLVIGILFLLS